MNCGIDLPFIRNIKGFMDDCEAERLFDVARQAAALGPLVEIGSYCGKSACIIGSALKEQGGLLFSIDHHHGSEEQQKGEEYFDPELYDEAHGCVDTLPIFRYTVETAGLSRYVIPVVGESAVVGRFWQTPIAMLFIDGGHSFEAARADYSVWSPHILPGGFLVIHDIFLDPNEGGQAPRQVYEEAVASRRFDVLEMTKTLGVLKRR